MSETLTKSQARQIWLRAQKLDSAEPFGHGPLATQAAVEHLGYVQIDTINVIERCHHHILFNRIPKYKRSDLQQAQAKDKSVFEYWTHALSYIPTRDFRFFMRQMKDHQKSPGGWFGPAGKAEFGKVLRTIKKEGPISIRDIDDDVLVEKNHPWASRKPSKKALQGGFFGGRFVISERVGMLKKYELADRHFGWDVDATAKPKAATEKETFEYRIDRALRSQGLVSLDSICHLIPREKPAILNLIEKRVKRGELIEVSVEGITKTRHWVRPLDFEAGVDGNRTINDVITHVLSPFDPLVIQRKRLFQFFDYEHRFEAYLPKEKRVFGYFALPVLVGDKVVAAIDLKTDRASKKLLIQKWSWVGRARSSTFKKLIESELHRFETFQLDI